MRGRTRYGVGLLLAVIAYALLRVAILPEDPGNSRYFRGDPFYVGIVARNLLEGRGYIGHSIGEFTAACVSGVLELEDALRLVALRGRLMDEMPTGAMTAVPLPEERVRQRIDGADDLWLSTVNGPALCVVSGPHERVEALEAKLSADGVECRRLNTSHAFHSGMMDDAVTPFVDAVRGTSIAAPSIPYASNVTGVWITEPDVRDPAYWGRHIREAVRFSQGMARLLDDPDRALLEVGPGRVLGTLARQQPTCGPERVVVPSLRRPGETSDDNEVLLGALGRLWTGGTDVDWSRLHEHERRRRAILPTYPFERERYWIERQRRRGAVRRRADLTDWFYAPFWRRTPAVEPAVGGPAAGCLVFGDDSPLARDLVAQLTAAGRRVTIVEPGETQIRVAEDRCEIDPETPEHYAELLGTLREADRIPGEIVHLWSSLEPADRGFNSLLFLGQALGASADSAPVRMTIVTEGVYDVTGDETIDPERASVLGPALVMPRELSNVTCRHVDVRTGAADGDHAATAKSLAAEILADSDDGSIAYRGGRRLVRSFGPARLGGVEGEPARLRADGTYLITGGLSGMGAVLAEYLARACRAKLVLVGRTPLPAREGWSEHVTRHGEEDAISRRILAVLAIEAAGGEVLAVGADVADEERMRRVIDEATRRFGGIDGVIHAAGVAGDGVIALKDPDEAGRVMAPKVAGGRVLGRLFADTPLDFMVLCSSLASVMGLPGQVDYSAANAYLDAFARRFAAETGTYTVAINWNRWGEVGMAVDYARSRGHAGALSGTSNGEGVELFRRVLAHGADAQIAISEVDLRDVLGGVQGTPRSADAASTPAVSPRPVVAAHPRPNLSTPYVEPQTEIERKLAEVWKALLGIESVSVDDHFFDLGGHSLLALEAARRMKDITGVNMPMVEFIPQTLGQVASLYEERLATVAPKPTKGEDGDLTSGAESVNRGIRGFLWKYFRKS